MSLTAAGADDGGESAHDDTEALRIASIFVILLAGVAGGYPPLMIKAFRDPDSATTRLVRSFSAGVILALALVHIVPEAVTEMDGLGGIGYPLGGTCVLFGIALMVLLEHTAHIAFTRSGSGSKGWTRCGHSDSLHSTGAERAVPLVTTAVAPAEDPPCHTPAKPSPEVCPTTDPALADPVTGHSHVCVSRGSASNWVAAAAVEAAGDPRLKVVAWLFEAGCVFHSVIIGLSLGVNQTDLTEVRSLLIALAFHQWLEGMSLGSIVALGGFSSAKGAAMIATYSLTCPVGIAVGMALAATYDGASERARGVQGAFNGVSGGMLLYISLVQLVAEDMGRLVPGRDSARVRLGCFAALCGGAAAMCLLAVWA